MKTNWTTVNKIINEEVGRAKKKMALKSRLKQINESIAELNSDEDENEKLDEVEAGGLTKIPSATGLEPNVKYKANWSKKGPHIFENEDQEEIDLDLDSEDDSEEDFDIAGDFAALGQTIEDKIKAALGISSDVDGEEEIEVEMPKDSETTDDEEMETEDETEEEEITSLNESVNPTKKGYLNIISEGMNSDKKEALSAEMLRMRKLATLDNYETH